ncbi:helix-turn-helix transcriptional regulator [Chryseobacterium gambrini]|uniref:helix-turn-helix transcriptional regulator n=1 Tax=Chryseobacterium gambrini TaxID=373672 RepID=UPI0022F406C5|nr:helix-turn-helix transcriptional regulator [Chryseobacterium gambrini]WBX97626.1 helix-turn-helix transcriptional regulator [Chryseobacterium gambrini]
MNPLHQPIEIFNFESTEAASDSKALNYNQFIYIMHGRGQLSRRGITTSFEKGDLLWIEKGCVFFFKFEEKAKMEILAFKHEAKLRLKELIEGSKGEAGVMARFKSPLNEKIRLCDSDDVLFHHTLRIMKEMCCYPERNSSVLYFQMIVLLNIIERNISLGDQGNKDTFLSKDISLILRYIHKNLKHPSNLKIAVLSRHFNMSANSLMLYFRKETKQSLKQYIEDMKMKLIQKQILQSNMRFSEIAYEFGFTDESHFNKRFRRYFGVSPKVFRVQKMSSS